MPHCVSLVAGRLHVGLCVVAMAMLDVLLINVIWNNDVLHKDTHLYTCICYVLVFYSGTLLCDDVITLKTFTQSHLM